MRLVRVRFAVLTALAATLMSIGVARPVLAQDRLMFSAKQNVRKSLVAYINAETVRLDLAAWYLTERAVTQAIVNRHRAGVPVRVIGDRISIFENDPNTTREFEYLASNGVPIRVRYAPTWFPEIMHWKAAIFVGQDLVEFGSANYTVYELAPWSPTNYHDEVALFTRDRTLVDAFKTRFDRYWADTTYFKNFAAAYQLERGVTFPVRPAIDRSRLEPNYPMPSRMVWSQGPALNDRITAEIEREPTAIDVAIFRLSAANVTSALVRRHRAGVRVRVIVEPSEYSRNTFPEYELTRARVDLMWAAGVPIKQRLHAGLMHMKTLITSRVALIASSNFTNNWQRDHNYFLPAATKRQAHLQMKNRFAAMWADGTAFGAFRPKPPAAARLATPVNGATGVVRTSTLVWQRATWAVAYDVYVGTSSTNLQRVARVPAVMSENPPPTYGWTPPTPLPSRTRLVWRVVSRTNATRRDPRLVARSEIWTFTTGSK